jgi:hypothetical protein
MQAGKQAELQRTGAGALQSKLYALPHVAKVNWFSEEARRQAECSAEEGEHTYRAASHATGMQQACAAYTT